MIQDPTNLSPLLKRLEIVKNYIELGDEEEITAQTEKIAQLSSLPDVKEIVTLLSQKEYAQAILLIKDFIQNQRVLAPYIDPEVSGLQLEIKNLELQLDELNIEKLDIEKLLSDFQYRHSQELGTYLLELLRLRKEHHKDNQKKYAEAEADEKSYQEELKQESKKEKFTLSDEEQQELKKKFRKSSTLCHPDKVSEEHKKAAEKIFIELKLAYEKNDLHKVSEILSDLENGNFFNSYSDTLTEKDKLKAQIAQLKLQILSLAKEIEVLKQQEVYKTVSSISDMDIYFAEMKVKLQKDIDYYQSL